MKHVFYFTLMNWIKISEYYYLKYQDLEKYCVKRKKLVLL